MISDMQYEALVKCVDILVPLVDPQTDKNLVDILDLIDDEIAKWEDENVPELGCIKCNTHQIK